MSFDKNTNTDYKKLWSKIIGERDVLLDPFVNHFTCSVILNDTDAYTNHHEYRHVYDKLWVAKSQNVKCGKLEELHRNENNIKYPIFIKPRWGHLSAASMNCYKINTPSELKNYSYLDNMMWSDFIDGTEQMTDFILLKGKIVYSITYKYSEKQNGFSDVWKYISPNTPVPNIITNWVTRHLNSHTGFVNVQYRNNTIIEVGLRPARNGAYIIATDNYGLIRNINNIYEKHYWDESLEKQMDFKPYYAFKCYTKFPILYLWPYKILEKLVSSFTNMPLFEYYFENVNNEGCVFLQFMHYNFEEGMYAKKNIEWIFFLTQLLVLTIILVVISLILYLKSPYRYFFLSVIVLLYVSMMFNSYFTLRRFYNCIIKTKLFKNTHDISPDEATDLHNKRLLNKNK